MSEEWQYQVRVNLDDERAAMARGNLGDPAIAPLADVLARHDAAIKCQYDAFADYCAAAEADGIEGYPLYAWTKATIDDPAKKAKYLKSFTLYVEGQEVYAKDKADALEADLQPLLDQGLITPLVEARYQSGKQPAATRALSPEELSGLADSPHSAFVISDLKS